MARIYATLLEIAERRGAGLFVLIDPDRGDPDALAERAGACVEAGADAILVGSSLLLAPQFEAAVGVIKAKVTVPVILFPGGVHQLARSADAILYISLISGRNPELLIGQQVKAAPLVHAMDLEAIGTGYLIVDSAGERTTAEFISGTLPLPRQRPELAVAHALAAEYLGMRMLYFDAGSGAKEPVPADLIRAVVHATRLPVIVGGGIRGPEVARAQVEAGARFVVVSSLVEAKGTAPLRELVSAVHWRAGSAGGSGRTVGSPEPVADTLPSRG
jgi:putative glycerol-1-phosphate prenyltransferase